MKKGVKWVVGILAVIVLLVLVALIVPFLVDFSSFKPQIQQVVSGAVNAQVDFESARLHILPSLGVKVKKLQVTNTDPVFNGTKLFSVDGVFFETALLPLFKKKFVGRVLIQKPEIVIARQGIKNNLGALSKPSTESAPEAKPEPGKQGGGLTKENVELIKNSVEIKSFEIQDAALSIKNLGAEGNKEPVKITDFDLLIENIGLEREIAIKLATKAAINDNGISVKGPITVGLTPWVKISDKGLDQATFKGKVDLDSLDINVRGAFVKPAGIPLNVMFSGKATSSTATIDDLKFNLHNLAMSAKVDVKDMKTLMTEASLNLKNDNLEQLGALLPQHKKMLMNGSLLVTSDVSGPLSEPKKVAANLAVDTKLTGSDLALRLNVKSMEPMNLKLMVHSNRLDLGALVKPFLPPEGEKPQQPAATPTGTAQPEQPAKDFELTADQKKMLENADVGVNVTMTEFLYDKIKLEKFVLNLEQKGLLAKLAELSLNGLGGNIKAQGSVNLGTSPISFNENFDLKNVRTEQLIELAAPEHKDVLVGSLNVSLNASGQGTTKQTLNKTLNGKGSFKLLEGELHSASVATLMQKEFDSFAGGLSVTSAADSVFGEAEKIMNNPLVKNLPNKPQFDIAKFKQQYSSFKNISIANKATTDKKIRDVSGNIEIKNGRVYLTMKNQKPEGLYDFAGSVGLDMTLDGGMKFIAADSTKAQLMKQSQYASLLLDDKKNLDLNMKLGGTVSAPTVKLDTAAIQDRFSKNAKALVEKEVKKAAEDAVNKVLKGQKDAVVNQLKQKQQELMKGKEGEAKDKAQKALKDKVKVPKNLFGN